MINKQNIVFINTIKGWGGGEHWHLEWATRLSNEYNVTIICNRNSELSKKAKAVNRNVVEIDLTNFSIFNPFKWLSFNRLIKSLGINSAFINLSRELKIFAPLLKLNNAKNIIYAKGSPTRFRNNLLNRILVNKYITKILCNSEATAKMSFRDFIGLEDKIKVIYHSLDTKEFDSVQVSKTQEKEKFLIKSLGRLSPEKNQIIFIDLAKELKAKGMNFEIQIAGSGISSDFIQNAILENNLGDFIKLVGFKQDTKQFLADGDVFILPSKWEGFGLVKLEAMALSLPIIAFDNSSNPETIIDNETGFLIENNNIKEMAEKIDFLYNNPEIRVNFGRNSRNLIEKKFDINVIYPEIISLIN